MAPPGRAQILHLRKLRGRAGGDAKAAEHDALSGTDLFALLWLALADVLGTAAAATLLRRAAQHGSEAFPELAALVITRESLEYRYQVPVTWDEPAAEPPAALCELVRKLWVLLTELTGSVVVGRLSRVAELRERGLAPPRERRS